MGINLKDIEVKFNKEITQLEDNMAFLKKSRKELSESKNHYDNVKKEYHIIEKILQESLNKIETMKSELTNRFEKEVENLQKVEKDMLEAQDKSFDYMENKLENKITIINKELMSLNKNIKNFDVSADSKIEIVKKSVVEADQFLSDNHSKIEKLDKSMVNLDKHISGEVDRLTLSIDQLKKENNSLKAELNELKEVTVKINKRLNTMVGMAIALGLIAIVIAII